MNSKSISHDQQLALFRFSIISPMIHQPKGQRTRYFKEMAKKYYDVPDPDGQHHRRRFSWKTFKQWFHLYQKGGFQSLEPITRCDKGVSRTIDEILAEAIQQKFKQFPGINIATLYRFLNEEGLIRAGSPSETAVRKFILSHDLKPTPPEPTPRKKFETPHVNDLWLSDFMHGQHLNIDGVRRKLFLCGIIDDHSRLIVGARWTLKENTEALELVFKDALATYGCPKLFYCDNGAVYASHHLQLVCARLGIALVHSKPYDSPSRGKIERFWRTVREGFLPMVALNVDYSLENYNQLFAEWLAQHYQRQFHHGIQQTPLDRFLDDFKNISPRRVAKEELELGFYQSYRRKVKNDATVAVAAVLYEVPAKYIGAFVELRHPTGQPFDLWLYENEKTVLKLQKVNLIENSRSASRGIRFAQNSNPVED